MTTTTAWAVYDQNGCIMPNSIRPTQEASETAASKETDWYWHSLYVKGYRCIPVTIKPKEDGE